MNLEAQYAEKIESAYRQLWEFCDKKRPFERLDEDARELLWLSARTGPDGRRTWLIDLLQGLLTKSRQELRRPHEEPIGIGERILESAKARGRKAARAESERREG